MNLSSEPFPKNIENVKHNPGSLLVFYGSGMLESGVDRIITQVVDPKMNHTFRPQIETAIHDFLSGDRRDENSTSGPCEQAETQEPPSGSGPKTPWDFIFVPNIQLKDIRISEIAIKISIILLQAHVLGSLHSVAHLFGGATRTTEKGRAWGYCKITWKVRSLTCWMNYWPFHWMYMLHTATGGGCAAVHWQNPSAALF